MNLLHQENCDRNKRVIPTPGLVRPHRLPYTQHKYPSTSLLGTSCISCKRRRPAQPSRSMPLCDVLQGAGDAAAAEAEGALPCRP
eukprot:CAMPEP_0114289950 /NCGR_PEP_ID=MMETSP0059-20121206/7660_1 /TAXON_ID=36894 /ORGANISM="Pyramimonas parkeae, Strain CCMP726" /LENGTH=84 /DNA_ID=CAMNT_0001411283 /DNA_START=130 /DNA_END=384 /DNA_ORIENTATION=-